MLLGIDQAVENMKNNMRDYNLPAPTEDTLDRYRTCVKVTEAINYLSTKYNINKMQVIDELRLTVYNATKQKEVSSLGQEILDHLDLKTIQDLVEGGTLETNYKLKCMEITNQFTKSPNLPKLASMCLGLMIKGIKPDEDPKVKTLPPEVAEEVRNIVREVETYLYQNHKQFLILDTETNSLPSKKPGTGLPIQVAWILVDNNMEVIKSDAYYISQDYVDYGAEKVHGISLEKLKTLNPVTPKEGYARIREELRDYNNILVAHNASFDIKVLERLKEQSNEHWGLFSGKAVLIPEICTLANARKEIPTTILKGKKLTDLQEFYGISTEYVIKKGKLLFGKDTTNHDARFDTVLLLEVIKRLKLK